MRPSPASPRTPILPCGSAASTAMRSAPEVIDRVATAPSAVRWMGFRSPSRTTSMSPVCRRQPGAPRSNTRRFVGDRRRSGHHRRGSGRREDQPGSVRDGSGRHALALRNPDQSLRFADRAGRLQFGLGRRGRRRARAVRARHGHRRIGSDPRGARQHRRPEADPRARQHRRGGASLPFARLRLGVRPDRARRIARTRGPRCSGRG